MNQRLLRLLRCTAIAALPCLAVAGCSSSDIDDTDTGGVILVVSDFGTLPLGHSLSTGGLMQIDSITVRSVVADPAGPSSELMTIRLLGYEVTYRRRDSGTRLPRGFIESVFGSITPNGTLVLNGLNMLVPDQFNATPFSDLLRTGVDSETGSAVVVLDINIRFFGETLGGRAVTSEVAPFTVRFVQ